MGAYLSIISGVIKLCNSIASMLQRHHDELNGANAQRVGDQDARTKVLSDLTAPVNQSESDRLWRDNVTKFGPTGGAGGQ